jgi:hypothetical protein
MSKIIPFFDHKGLDLVSSDQSRPENFASLIDNGVLEGGIEAPRIEKRKGSQVKGTNFGGFGLIEFTRLNPTTAEQEKELLAIEKDSLYRIKKATAAISYGGAGTTATVAIAYAEASSQLALTLTVDGAIVLTYTLGQGYEEATTKTLADMKTAVEAITGWTCTLTGTTSLPAAFCDVTPATSAKSTSITFTVYEREAVTAEVNTVYSDLSGVVANQDQTDFEEISYTSLNNVLYIAAGALIKYDGQRCFYAGLNAPTISVSQHSSGTLDAGTRTYKARAVRVDNVGNVIRGPFSAEVSVTNIANRDIQVEAYGGVGTYGTVNGAQSATTINVDSGHLFVTGDMCYLKNGSTYEARRITATTATTLTFDASVSVTDNQELTLYSYIEVWRTEDGGALFYLVENVPAVASGNYYYDSMEDATLNANESLTEPDYDFGRPPACRYVCTYRGGLVVSGVPFTTSNRLGQYDTINQVSPNDVWFGDYENVEGFPTDGSFTVSVESDLGDIITGMKEIGNSLVIFKNKSIKRLYGDPTQLDMQAEWLSKETGCLAHATIQEIQGRLFFLSNRGVETIIETQAPTLEVGYRVKPIVEIAGLSTYATPKFKRARAHVFVPKQYYILWLPCEGSTAAADTYNVAFLSQGDGVSPGTVAVSRSYANANSRILVFDYFHQAWYEWSDLNMAGGIATYNDELWWVERRYSTYSSAVKYNLMKRINNNHATDYEDHNQPISFRWGTAWLAFGDRKVKKQPLRLAVASTQETPSNDYTLTVKQEVNFVRDTTKAQMSLAVSESATHGVTAQTKLANGKFTASRFLFENAEHNTNVELEGWEVEVDLPYVGELKI